MKILKTEDGGRQWSVVCSHLTGSAVRDFQFLNADYGWLVHDGGVYITKDGGRSWKIEATPQISGCFHSFWTDGRRSWLAVSQKECGTVFHRWDGERWHKVMEFGDGPYCPEFGGIYFVGKRGFCLFAYSMLETNNSGKSWEYSDWQPCFMPTGISINGYVTGFLVGGAASPLFANKEDDIPYAPGYLMYADTHYYLYGGSNELGVKGGRKIILPGRPEGVFFLNANQGWIAL